MIMKEIMKEMMEEEEMEGIKDKVEATDLREGMDLDLTLRQS